MIISMCYLFTVPKIIIPRTQETIEIYGLGSSSTGNTYYPQIHAGGFFDLVTGTFADFNLDYGDPAERQIMLDHARENQKPTLYVGDAGYDYFKNQVEFDSIQNSFQILLFWAPIVVACFYFGIFFYLILYWILPLFWIFSSLIYWSEIETILIQKKEYGQMFPHFQIHLLTIKAATIISTTITQTFLGIILKKRMKGFAQLILIFRMNLQSRIQVVIFKE